MSARTVATPPVRLGGMKVGVYGSQDVLLAFVLAGYALGRFEHSDRVRGSWVGPMPGVGLEVPWGLLPAGDPRTRRGFAAWAALDHGDRGWLALNPGTIARGRRLRPVTCPVLSAVLRFYDVRNDFTDPTRGFLGPADVAALADAVEACLPHLDGTAWQWKVAEFARVVRTAADHDGIVSYG